MGLLENLAIGFSSSLSFVNIIYCLAGAILGTAVGVLPGLGPVATIAMLLPLTFSLEPVTAMIMLAGVYYGSQYGGSTTAILLNLPGEASSMVTALDGYRMARNGRAGAALATAALGSFFAGCVATVVLALLSPPLAELALRFGAPEYFSLMLLGLLASVTLASGSILNALAMIVFGLLLGLVGQDVYTGIQRFTFGVPELSDGIDFVAIAMGMFGINEVIRNLEQTQFTRTASHKIGRLLLTATEIKTIIPPILRGTALGSLLGILPGGGALLSSFGSYALEKRLADDPSRFGNGAIEGVAGPESANNAGAQTSFIPMLTLGIPSNAVMALMMGGLIVHGIAPGPNVIGERPELFWGLVTSMWVGNTILVLLNLPLIGLWVRMLTIPYRLLFPIIVAVCCIGVYSISNSPVDLAVMAIFGVLGYMLIKLGCEPAPMLLGFILGRMVEEHFRRAMMLSQGDPMIFVQRPISATLLILAALTVALIFVPRFMRTREVAFRE